MSDESPRVQGRRWGKHHMYMPPATYNKYASKEAEARFDDEQKQDDFFTAAIKYRMR